LSAAENCVEAVAKCDIFFGIIGKRYGSGKDESMEKSIMHLEISRSIELDKLRWFMVDHDVVVARNILKQYRFDKEGNPRPDFAFERTAMLEDIRTLELYEEVIQQGEKALKDRKGNWVQEYRTWSDVTLFVDSQLKNIELTKELIANGREVEK